MSGSTSVGQGQTAPSKDVTQSFRRNRAMLLDCIRGVAIIGVVVFHVAKRYEVGDLDYIAMLFRRFGLLGVDVFFPLSGFLITHFLLRAQTGRDIGVFFMRRFFRIVPLYMAAVTIYLLASLYLHHEPELISRIWIPYTFLTGWFVFFQGEATVPYTITWSLSVEEFAYILFGLTTLLFRKHLVTFMIAISIFAFTLRLYVLLNGYEGVYNFPPARLDSIAMGGLLAAVINRGHRFLPFVLAVSCAVVFVVALNLPILWETLKFTFITLGTLALIASAQMYFKDFSTPMLGWLSSIGFYSYFTYLFHFFTIHGLVMLDEKIMPGSTTPFWIMAAFALLITHAMALFSFRVFEGPILRFGRTLE